VIALELADPREDRPVQAITLRGRAIQAQYLRRDLLPRRGRRTRAFRTRAFSTRGAPSAGGRASRRPPPRSAASAISEPTQQRRAGRGEHARARPHVSTLIGAELAFCACRPPLARRAITLDSGRAPDAGAGAVSPADEQCPSRRPGTVGPPIARPFVDPSIERLVGPSHLAAAQRRPSPRSPQPPRRSPGTPCATPAPDRSSGAPARLLRGTERCKLPRSVSGQACEGGGKSRLPVSRQPARARRGGGKRRLRVQKTRSLVPLLCRERLAAGVRPGACPRDAACGTQVQLFRVRRRPSIRAARLANRAARRASPEVRARACLLADARQLWRASSTIGSAPPGAAAVLRAPRLAVVRFKRSCGLVVAGRRFPHAKRARATCLCVLDVRGPVWRSAPLAARAPADHPPRRIQRVSDASQHAAAELRRDRLGPARRPRPAAPGDAARNAPHQKRRHQQPLCPPAQRFEVVENRGGRRGSLPAENENSNFETTAPRS